MGMRLQRFIAQSGLASRRKAEEWIKLGQVQVNGDPADIGAVINPDKDVVSVKGETVPSVNNRRYFVVNKPVGYTTSLKDRHAEHLISELIPEKFGRLFPVGRLDRETSGLIVMTSDGDLAFRLMHPSFQVPKVYNAWVEGVPRENHLERLERGISLQEGVAKARDIRVLRTEKNQALVQLTLTEGKKREVRRIFQSIGHPVISLERIKFGPISLEGIESGQFRPLTHREVKELQISVKLAVRTTDGTQRRAVNHGREGRSKISHKRHRAHSSTSSPRTRNSVRNTPRDS